MALAIDSLLVYFLKLLQMEMESKELRNQRRHLIFTACTTFLVHPISALSLLRFYLKRPIIEGTYIERYPQTLIDFVNHRQSVLSNVANHLLSLMHLLVPNMTDVLPELVDETSAFALCCASFMSVERCSKHIHCAQIVSMRAAGTHLR